MIAGASACEFRPLGASDWHPADIVWRGEACDAALLRSGKAGAHVWPDLRLGRVATEPDGPRAVPSAFLPRRRRSREAGQFATPRRSRERSCRSPGRKGELLTVHVAGNVPLATQTARRSPWQGMSGAALFTGPLLVGILSVSPGRFGSGRLEAVPITAMAVEAGFRSALGAEGAVELRLEAVEDALASATVLRDAYRALPDSAPPSLLLRATFGTVPVPGRVEEPSRSLQSWCASDAPLAAALVAGSGGSGKTRLAAERASVRRSRGGFAGSSSLTVRVRNATRLRKPRAISSS